jgi:hypothetical protein
MMFQHRFVNRIIGVAAGFRDVALNYVYDNATFELIERNATDFPIATRYRRVPQDGEWHQNHDGTTLWHDGSHWTCIGVAKRMSLESETELMGTAVIREEFRKQEAFPLDTPFRDIVENDREETVVAIQNHLSRNLALIDGAIWRRGNEPSFSMRLTETDVAGGFRSITTRNPGSWAKLRFEDYGFQGQRFRLDDVADFRETILGYMDRGWKLTGTNGITWNVPDVEVLVPESISLDPEAQTVVDLAYSLQKLARPAMKDMSYTQLEAVCHLLETFEKTQPLGELFNERQISELLDAARSIADTALAHEAVSAPALELAVDRWENRAIALESIRSHKHAF